MTNPREIEQIGNLLISLTSVVEELVRITHHHHPHEVEDYLRRQRLLVQEAATDRSALESPQTLPSHRMELRLLERALRRDGAPATTDP